MREHGKRTLALSGLTEENTETFTETRNRPQKPEYNLRICIKEDKITRNAVWTRKATTVIATDGAVKEDGISYEISGMMKYTWVNPKHYYQFHRERRKIIQCRNTRIL